MKSFLLFSAGVLTTACIVAQTIVPTTPQPRNAVLEEFTGINCPNCPDGHVRATSLYNAYPKRVVIINIHSGSFATPSTGQPDFRTSYGSSFDSFSGLTGYPAGMMNRKLWPGAYNQAPYYPQNPPNALAIRRPGWWDTSYPGQTAGEWIILNGGNSPVNIATTTTWNGTTRNLKVDVELYYTANDTVANELNVAFLENNVVGYQSNGGSSYNHMHILREMITGQWGDTISNTSQGRLVTKTYNYTVPASFNINNCEVSVFVTRNNHKNIHTGVTAAAVNGTGVTSVDDIKSAGVENMNVYPNPITDKGLITFSINEKSIVDLSVYNLLGEIVHYENLGEYSKGSHTKQLEIKSKTAAGIYFVKLKAGQSQMTQKIMIQ